MEKRSLRAAMMRLCGITAIVMLLPSIAALPVDADTPPLSGITSAVRSDSQGARILNGIIGVVSVGTGLQYYPLPSPIRVLDTRAGASACLTGGGSIRGGSSLGVHPGTTCAGIPANAQALVGNATVVNNLTNSPAGYATLYPSGASLPLVSNLNYVAGSVVPNAFTVGVGGDGGFNIYASTTIDFIVDLTGYYAPPGAGGLYFHSLPSPVRLFDTRSGSAACNARGAPLVAGASLNLSAATGCTGVPASAQAIVGNATVVNSKTVTPPGYATLYPGSSSLPNVSNLNYVSGQVVPNAFTVGVSGGTGSFNVYATTGIDFVIDIAGYYDTNSSGLVFTPLASPIRWLDTRSGATACLGGAGPHVGGLSYVDVMNFTCGGVTLPSNAVAIAGNATAIADAGGGPGYVTLHPGGTNPPNASNLNYVNGQVVPNAFIVGLGSGPFAQAYQIYASTTVDEIVDISGYFSSASGSAPSATSSTAGKIMPNTARDTKRGGG